MSDEQIIEKLRFRADNYRAASLPEAAELMEAAADRLQSLTAPPTPAGERGTFTSDPPATRDVIGKADVTIWGESGRVVLSGSIPSRLINWPSEAPNGDH